MNIFTVDGFLHPRHRIEFAFVGFAAEEADLPREVSISWCGDKRHTAA